MSSEWTESNIASEFDVQLGKRVDTALARGVPKQCINNRGVRWGRIDVTQAATELLTKADIRELRLVRGDVLVCEGGEIGRASVWRDELPEGYYLNTLHRLRSKGRYQPGLIAAFLERWATTGELQALVGKSSLAHLTKENLLRVPLPMPSPKEQERIVEALYAADELLQALERMIAKSWSVRQGMMQELLVGRTRLPGFGAEWPEVMLGDHVSYLSTVALSRDQLDQESPLRYLHYGDIHTGTSSRLDAAAESMPRAPAWLAARAGRLASGDVVFADASEDLAGVGKSVEITAVPAEGAVPGLHTIAARFDKQTLADGFKGYLQFVPAFRESLLRLAAGTKVLATTRRCISGVRLKLPDTGEQTAIAAVLMDVDAQIDALRARLHSARAVKTGMMQELLTGRARLTTEEALL